MNFRLPPTTARTRRVSWVGGELPVPQQQPLDYHSTGVQIGGGRFGMRPLAQLGDVVIGGGLLSLLGDKGNLIDQAPIADVEVKRILITGGQVAWVRMPGRRYSVSGGTDALGRATVAGVGHEIRGTNALIKALNVLKGD